MNAHILRVKFQNSYIPSFSLLAQAKMLDAASRDTPAFNDTRYFPFYYHLGVELGYLGDLPLRPKRVCQIGSKLGLIGACFMKGCDSVEEWSAMESYDEYPPASLIRSNLRLNGKAKVDFMMLNETLMKQEWPMDLAMLTEKYESDKVSEYLEFFWKRLSPEGLLVVDYIEDDAVREPFKSFCRVKNREPEVFDTRYGVGIIKR
jgi:hypothetical protein